MTIKESLWDRLKEETAEDFSLLSLAEAEERPDDCYLVKSDSLGGEHGEELLADLFITMENCRCYPQYILLIDRGVFLAAKGHRLCSVLAELEKNGSTVMVSEKSAQLYGLADKIDPVLFADTGRLLGVMNDAVKVITL